MNQGNVYKWSFIDRFSIALINFGVNIALARMLTTADYGLLAMITIFIAVASDLSSCGLSDGLIHKTNPSERDYSTVFVFNAAFGLLFGASFFICAPLVADFFGHEELVGIMRILGVCFFFQTMSYVQETRLRKKLDTKKICFVHVGGTLTVSVLAIVAAALGYGYKALICTQILLSAFYFTYYLLATRWFPKIDFSVKSFRELFSYGVHLMLAYMASVVGRNVNTSVLGKFYPSPSASGVYYQGAKLAVVPFGVTEASLNYPFFAVASNEQDKEKQRALIHNMFVTILGLNGALMMFMLVIAAPGIELLYGDRWLGAIPVFRILAIAEFLVCVRAFFQTVCKVHARTAFVRNMGFVEVGAQLLLLLAFYRYGILWIAWTQVMGVALTTFVYTMYCRRTMFRLSLASFSAMCFKAIWLPALSTAVSAAVAFAVPDCSPLIMCMAIALAYIVVFTVVGELTGTSVYVALKRFVVKRRK